MEIVIRVTVIYIVILAGLRILGKREFGQLSPLELITLLLIPELVSQSLIGEEYSLTGALIGVATLFALVFITSVIRYFNSAVERVISGTPCVLVSHGEFLIDNLHRERVDPDEIMGEIHKAGLYRLDQVKWAILESDGKIAIIPEVPTSQFQPSDEERATG